MQPVNASGRPSILLVEDEPQQREVLQLILESEGYGVFSAESAEDALRFLIDQTPTILVTDVKLPGLDGFGLYEKIKENETLKSIPTIFITAYNDPTSIERAKQFGASAYITKPYNVEELLKLIKEVLAR